MNKNVTVKGEFELNLNTQYVITITCFLTFDNLNVSLAKMFELTLGLNGPLYVLRAEMKPSKRKRK